MDPKLSEVQKRTLKKLSLTEPKSAYDLRVPLTVLWAMVGKGVARDVTPPGAGGMFAPRTHYKFLRAAPVTAAMPPEHDFSVRDVDAWEETVVKRAEYFTVVRSLHNGQCVRHEFNTLEEAIKLGRTDRRYLVSAVAPTGRFATLDRGKWDHFLKVYKDKEASSVNKSKRT